MKQRDNGTPAIKQHTPLRTSFENTNHGFNMCVIMSKKLLNVHWTTLLKIK